ncbi:MAG: hypothetical protein ABJA32_12345, partial [Ginsengibacter sp.]
IPSYRYLVAYHYNIKHDKDSAIIYNDKILTVEPADPTALKTKEALSAVPKKPSAPAAAPPAKKARK